jgi:hypothetical protein
MGLPICLLAACNYYATGVLRGQRRPGETGALPAQVPHRYVGLGKSNRYPASHSGAVLHLVGRSIGPSEDGLGLRRRPDREMAGGSNGAPQPSSPGVPCRRIAKRWVPAAPMLSQDCPFSEHTATTEGCPVPKVSYPGRSSLSDGTHPGSAGKVSSTLPTESTPPGTGHARETGSTRRVARRISIEWLGAATPETVRAPRASGRTGVSCLWSPNQTNREKQRSRPPRTTGAPAAVPVRG